MIFTKILIIIFDLAIIGYTLYFPHIVLKAKPNYKIYLIVIFLIYLIINTFWRINYSKDPNSLYIRFSPIKTAMYFLLLTIYYCFAFENKISSKLITLAIVEIYIFVLEVPLEVIFFLYFDYLISVMNEFSIVLAVNILALAIFITFTPLIKKITNKLILKKFSTSIIAFVIILVLQSFILVTLSYCTFAVQKNLLVTMSLLSIISLLISDIVLYRIILTNSKNYELKEQVRALELKNELDLKYYERLKKGIYETRKLNHDFNNILMILENNNFNSENEKNILLDEIKSLIRKNQIKKFCENELVNVIIANKFETITENNIDFSTNLSLSNDISIKKLDLCRIFTNIIDNAIESCLSCKDKNGFIILTSKVENDYLYIKCENYCEILKQDSNGKFISTKKDHKGLGTKILDNIAKEYNGNFSSKYEDNMFTSLISLNIKTQL